MPLINSKETDLAENAFSEGNSKCFWILWIESGNGDQERGGDQSQRRWKAWPETGY
jgi:hypothetical protein